MKHAINWFAIPVTDLKRAVKFYNEIFGFQMQETKMGNNEMAFFPIEEGGIGGHLFVNQNSKPSAEGVTIFLNGGDNLQNILGKVEAAGSKVTTPKTMITEEIGYFGTFLDSEGNRISLHSPH